MGNECFKCGRPYSRIARDKNYALKFSTRLPNGKTYEHVERVCTDCYFEAVGGSKNG